jgi:predicted HicB family RNase H-like nuclease
MKCQPHKGTVGYTLRLPKQTREAARVEAARMGMSLNLFLVQTIDKALPKPKPRTARKQPA